MPSPQPLRFALVALLLALPRLADAALTASKPPAELIERLRSLVLERGSCERERWTEPGELRAEVVVARPDGSLLFFLQIPDYFCRSSNAAVPVLVDAKGHWRWGEPLDGVVTRAVAAPDGTLVVATQWQIEGTYPSLFTSRDGLAWAGLALPEERATRGPDESAEICFGSRLLLRLRSELEGKSGGWSLDFPNGAWQPADQARCPEKQPSLAGGWKRSQGRTELIFRRGSRRIALPRLLAPGPGAAGKHEP